MGKNKMFENFETGKIREKRGEQEKRVKQEKMEENGGKNREKRKLGERGNNVGKRNNEEKLGKWTIMGRNGEG